MTEIDVLVLVFGGTIVLYPVYRFILIKAMQPVRLAFADEGIRLLNSPDIPEDEKEIIDRYLDDAFDWRTAIVLAVGVVPVILWKGLRDRLGPKDIASKSLRSFVRREESRDFLNLHLFCIMGSNPIAALIFFTELLVFMPIALLVYHGMREVIYRLNSRVIGPLATRFGHS